MLNSISRRVFSTFAIAAASITFVSAPASAQNPIKIAYLSPSFDISDAWEHVYWSIQGRLE